MSTIAHQVESVRKAPLQLALAPLREDRAAVKAELSDWLSNQASALDCPEIGLIEVFAGMANLSRHCERDRSGASIRIGKAWGHDLSRVFNCMAYS